MKRLMVIAAMGVAMLGTGCSIVGGGRVDADSGEKVWSVLGSNENWAFNDADRLCPYGYYVHNELPNRPLPPLYILEIECKPESSKAINLVLHEQPQEATNPGGVGKPGQYSYVIEHLDKVAACNEMPQALLESKAPGAEVYSVQCHNEELLKVRCEFSNCYVMQ